MDKARNTSSFQAIRATAAASHLDVFGAFHPRPADKAPSGTGTLLLLGPKEPDFWNHINSEPEFSDGSADPVDRWSRRVVSDLAVELNATPVFPFGGPPHAPFMAWAIRAGHVWTSVVKLLVHDTAGLFVSFRGAIALPDKTDLPEAGNFPCDTCTAQPCRSACPVGALTPSGYDLAACHSFLDTAKGADCMDCGCVVRRACPISRSCGRNRKQSAHHMKAFHP